MYIRHYWSNLSRIQKKTTVAVFLLHIVLKFRPFIYLQSASGRFRFLVPPSGTTCSPRRFCAVTRGFQTTTQDQGRVIHQAGEAEASGPGSP